MSDKAGAVVKAQADHSSFVDHLRLIHFTLCLTCFIAIIAVSAKSPSSAQRAYDQSNLLLRLQTKWDGGKWLDEIVNKNKPKNPGFQATVEITGNPSQTLNFQPLKLYALGRYRFPWFAFAKKEQGGLTTLKQLKPHDDASIANLEDAITIWNALGDFQYMVTPSEVLDGWMIKDSSVVEAKLNGGNSVAVSTVATATVGQEALWFVESDAENNWNTLLDSAPSRIAIATRIGWHNAQCYFKVYLERGTLLFPDRCKIERIELQRLLGDTILRPEFPFGDFNQSFPDVSDLGKGLKTLGLIELRDHFQVEQARTDDKVELPLVKLPAESIAYWATAIIFLLAAYWFAVFRDFSLRAKPDDKAWDSPWLGTSTEYSSQKLFLATIILPACTAAYLIYNGLGRSFGWELRVPLTVAAFVAVSLPTVGVFFLWRGTVRTAHAKR